MDELWRALSHARRREILALCATERSAGEVAAAFACTRPAVSQHLSALKAAGLLEERREGTRRLYRTQPLALEPLRELLRALAPGPAAGAAAAAAPGPARFTARLEVGPEEAFALFADPARLARWKGPLHGRFVHLEAPRRLSFTAGFSAAGAGRARVEVRIAADGGGSTLELAHEGPAAEAWPHYLARLEGLARGWDPGPDPYLQNS